MATLSKHKVLIVEDRAEIATRLRTQVSAHPALEVCGVAGTLAEALELFHETRPRIFLVDLGLPDGSGVDAIRAARKVDWPCDVLVISIFGDEARVLEAIAAGAKGYILKGGSRHDVCADIVSVLEGGSPISPQIARHLLAMVRLPARPETGDSFGIQLTPREVEILQAVARGYKRREIAELFSLSPGTVGNHIHNIYRKLDVGSNTEAVAQATRIGLL